ncbi:MAG TPA: hypothetical protein VN921_01430 [Chthoniobacterales bacterium]|nr:hypothetical protein [Chthoniobacterales bacterium]
MTIENRILAAQIAGFIVGLVGLFIPGSPGRAVFAIGFAGHFVGDAFFYFELKRKGYI